MKVSLLSGSPKARGNTAAALAEIVQVGHLPVRGCIALSREKYGLPEKDVCAIKKRQELEKGRLSS